MKMFFFYRFLFGRKLERGLTVLEFCFYGTFLKDCFVEGCSVNTNLKLSHTTSIQSVASTLCKYLLSYVTFHFILFLNERIHWSLMSLILEVPLRDRAVVKMKAQIMQILIPVV